MLAFALALALFADPPGETVFDDWAVACSNIKECVAVALQPVEWEGAPTQMSIGRSNEGGVWIDIRPIGFAKEMPIGESGGTQRVLIDGREVVAAPIYADVFQAKPEAIPGLLEAMLGGKELTIVTPDGKTGARVSLAGLSAALRQMDKEQGREGTVTAFVAKGDRPESAVPAPPAILRVRMLKAPEGVPAPKIGKARLAQLNKLAGCDFEQSASEAVPEFHRLDRDAVLALLPCGSGAYNTNSAAIVIRGAKAEKARFDIGPDWSETSDTVLTNARFSPEQTMLHHLDKGRGLGDCGTTMVWGWDGSRFRLIQATHLEVCRGVIEWPMVYEVHPEWAEPR